MAFTTLSVLTEHTPAALQNHNTVTARLRRFLSARRQLRGQQRVERYVAHLPTAVLGAS